MSRPLRLAALTVACISVAALAVSAGEIRVMTSGAFAAAHLELSPRFQQRTLRRLSR